MFAELFPRPSSHSIPPPDKYHQLLQRQLHLYLVPPQLKSSLLHPGSYMYNYLLVSYLTDRPLKLNMSKMCFLLMVCPSSSCSYIQYLSQVHYVLLVPFLKLKSGQYSSFLSSSLPIVFKM